MLPTLPHPQCVEIACVDLKNSSRESLFVNFKVAQVSFDCRRVEVQTVGLPLLTLKELVALAGIDFPSGAKS